MSAVWKFVMEHPRDVFNMPPGATVLSAGRQNDQIVVWAEVNPGGTLSRDEWEQRVFSAINTGDQLPPDRIAFVGTVQIPVARHPMSADPSEIVWHVYEVRA